MNRQTLGPLLLAIRRIQPLCVPPLPRLALTPPLTALSTGALLTGTVLLHLSLTHLNALPRQHVPQARQGLIHQLLGLRMLHQDVYLSLLLLIHLQLNTHLAQPFGFQLQLGLVPLLPDHQG